MKKCVMLLAFPLIAGCLAEVEVTPCQMSLERGDEAVAFVTCKNVCYSFFSLWPVCSGEPWRGEEKLSAWEPERAFWKDEATLANNMAMVRAAAKEVGSKRLGELRTELDDRSFWSFWICNRHEITTTATILKEPKVTP